MSLRFKQADDGSWIGYRVEDKKPKRGSKTPRLPNPAIVTDSTEQPATRPRNKRND